LSVLVTWHFVTMSKFFAQNDTFKHKKTTHQMLPPLCIVYQVLRCLHSHEA